MATCDGLGGERMEYVGEAITELGEGRYLECEEGGSRLVASVNDASLGIV
jgi:hypothetical protein